MEGSRAKAVIWDMDGVIIDTGQYHFRAWREIFSRQGIKFSEEDFRHSFGQKNNAIIPYIIPGVSGEEIEAISVEKEAEFRRRIGGNLKPLPGAIGLLSALKEKKFKMALASSSTPENIQMIVTGLQIGKYFDVIITDKDVIEGKPDPQVFLLAARRLGVKPEDCIVVEDAVVGVTAAKRAGMHCLAVTTTHPGESLREADIIVDSFEELKVADFERLLTS